MVNTLKFTTSVLFGTFAIVVDGSSRVLCITTFIPFL